MKKTPPLCSRVRKRNQLQMLKDNGISAVMGRLKGETTMTVQSYVFDKSKWTVERARKWVADHKKVLVIVIEEKEAEPGGPDKCVCPKCGEKVDKERGVPCRSTKCPKCGEEMVADEDAAEPKKEQGSGAQDLVTIMIEMSQIEIALAKAEAGPISVSPTSVI
jgi:DNA-directed RNA polymerase subunit M/transcription elongation factor TFIIS